MSDHPRTTTVLRRIQGDLAEVASDLADARRWLEDHADDLSDVDVASIRLYGVSMLQPTGLSVNVQCRDAKALARVTRALIHRAGLAPVTKDLREVEGGDQHGHVIRQFGRVQLDVWASYPCTTERRITPGGAVEATATCPPLLSLAVA